MKGGKDEGRGMDPLFPRLHISEADKGGPRAPPRNKIALCEQYNVACQGPKFRCGSMSSLPGNACGGLPSQPSSSNAGSDKGKVLPTSRSVLGSSHLTERHYYEWRDGVISKTFLIKSEPQMSGPELYQHARAPDDVTMKTKCSFVQPNSRPGNNNLRELISGDENEFKVPHFLQLHPIKEKGAAYNSFSSGKLHNVSLKLPSVMRCVDQTSDHNKNPAEENDTLLHDSVRCSEMPRFFSLMEQKNSFNASLAINKFPDLGISDIQPIQLKKSSSQDEHTPFCGPHGQLLHECKFLQKSATFCDGKFGMPGATTRKRCAASMDDFLCASVQHGNCDEPAKTDLTKECSKNTNSETFPVGSIDNKHYAQGTCSEASLPGLDLTPEDVISIFGQRLFWRARKIIIHQQRVFSAQIFELHRLIKVQRLIAGSPDILHEKHFHPNNPSVEFPPINKLLYVTPLDPLPEVASKTRLNLQKSGTDKDCDDEGVSAAQPQSTSNAEKGHLFSQLIPKALPLPPTSHSDAKLAPWCVHPPPGNPWSVPTRSPSEGLTYKSYKGSYFSTSGLMAPFLGNCGPGTAYGMPVTQNFFPPYCLPVMNTTGSDHEVKQMISSSGFNLAELDKDASTGNTNLASDHGRNIEQQGSNPNSPSQRLEGKTLSLFPTTPSCCEMQTGQSKAQVIKVMPHSRRVASESAARILQFIQDERRKT